MNEPQAPKPMQAEAAAWAAEERSAQEKVAPPSSPSPEAPPTADAKATADLLVTLIDFALTNWVSKNLKLNDDEASLLKEKAAPVVAIYFPPELFVGPLGALALTAGSIYAAKMFAQPPPSTETIDGTASEAQPTAPSLRVAPVPDVVVG